MLVWDFETVPVAEGETVYACWNWKSESLNKLATTDRVQCAPKLVLSTVVPWSNWLPCFMLRPTTSTCRVVASATASIEFPCYGKLQAGWPRQLCWRWLWGTQASRRMLCLTLLRCSPTRQRLHPFHCVLLRSTERREERAVQARRSPSLRYVALKHLAERYAIGTGIQTRSWRWAWKRWDLKSRWLTTSNSCNG